MSSAAGVWIGVDRLLGGDVSLDDLRAHRLQLLAARSWRTRGRAVPADLRAEEQRAAVLRLTTPLALEQVRAVCDGPLLLLKGPELAALYPDPATRPSSDVDLLVPDPNRVQQQLVDAGFLTIGRHDSFYDGLHHLRPLWHPQLGVKLEIHRRPEWVKWGKPPPADELLAVAVPSAVEVDGICALPPAEHALVVASHSWSNLPLRRLLDLIDIGALAVYVDRDAVDVLAERWDVGGVWRTMIAAADAILLDAPTTWPLRTWASDLPAIREPTVLRTHVRRLAGPLWALPPRRALVETGRALSRELRPAAHETWADKRGRSRLAVRNAFRRRSDHERSLLR